MSTLDLRNAGKLLILVLAGKPWNFELTTQAGAPSLTGASATMVITGSVTRTMAIGTGLTITATNKIAVVPLALPYGLYDYTMDITPLTGEIIRIIGKINATNE